jgi:hypothetical protein
MPVCGARGHGFLSTHTATHVTYGLKKHIKKFTNLITYREYKARFLIFITYIVLLKKQYFERDSDNITETWLFMKDERLEYNSSFDVDPFSYFILACISWDSMFTKQPGKHA